MSFARRHLERLSAVVRTERGRLIALARSEGLNAEDALECVQDALCTYLARGDESTLEYAIASVKTIVRNAARNFRRRHFRSAPHDDLGERSPRRGAPRPCRGRRPATDVCCLAL